MLSEDDKWGTKPLNVEEGDTVAFRYRKNRDDDVDWPREKSGTVEHSFSKLKAVVDVDSAGRWYLKNGAVLVITGNAVTDTRYHGALLDIECKDDMGDA